MVTAQEAFEAMELFGKVLRGEYVPPKPEVPKADKCGYCGKSIEPENKCGCGANK